LLENSALSISWEISNECHNGSESTAVRNGNSNLASYVVDVGDVCDVSVGDVGVVGVVSVGVVSVVSVVSVVGVVSVVSVGVNVIALADIARSLFNHAADSELQAAEIHAGFTCSTSDFLDVGVDRGEGGVDVVESTDDSGEVSGIADELEHLLESGHSLTDLLNSVDSSDNITTETGGT